MLRGEPLCNPRIVDDAELLKIKSGVTDYVGARGDCDPARTFMPAGQGMGMIHEIRPAADIMQEIVVDARETLARLGHLA